MSTKSFSKISLKRVLFLTMLVFGVYLLSNIYVKIEPGEAGVLYRRFGDGTDTENVFKESVWKWPWNYIYIYSTTKNSVEESFKILDINGLEHLIKYSTTFKVDEAKLGLLHKNIGPDYIQRTVIPEIESLIRKIAAAKTSDELATLKRKSFPPGENHLYLKVDAIFIEDITHLSADD